MEPFRTQRKVFVFLFAFRNCFKIKSLKGSLAANLIINRLKCHSDVIQLSLVSLKELKTEKRIRKAFILHVIKKAFSSLIFQNLDFLLALRFNKALMMEVQQEFLVTKTIQEVESARELDINFVGVYLTADDKVSFIYIFFNLFVPLYILTPPMSA